MEILRQIGVILGVCLAGVLLSSFLPLPVPANVLGMVLLFALLCLRIVKPSHIEKTGDFLLRNMSFFFIPASVGIMEYYAVVKDHLVLLLLICAITAVLTFAVTAYTVIAIIRLQERRKKKGE